MRSPSDPKVERLRKLELFAGLSDKELRRASRLVSETVRSAGTVLMQQGRPGAEAFVIVDGSVSVSRDGHELAQLGPGAVVGELALVEQAPRSATVVAESDVVVLVFSRPEFSRLLYELPSVGQRVLRQVGRRLRAIDASFSAASGVAASGSGR